MKVNFATDTGNSKRNINTFDCAIDCCHCVSIRKNYYFAINIKFGLEFLTKVLFN